MGNVEKAKKENWEISGKEESISESDWPVTGLGGLIFIMWMGRLSLMSPLKQTFISYNQKKAQLISQRWR